MGLRTELASGDGIDWTQQGMVKSSTGGVGITDQPVRPPPQQQKQRQAAGQQQQQGPHLRCPRCNSTNTKFCYYNNYSRVQPRHLCKACRRHWTEGGTLRNVPVGGGRKAKRPKTSHPSSASPAADPAAADDANAVMPAASAQLLPPLSFPQDHLLSPPLLPSSLPPLSAYANTGYLSALLSLPLTPRAAGVVDGAGGCSFSASTTFSPFLSLAGQEDLAAGIAAGSTATPPPPPPPLWELLPPPGPPTCSGGAGGSSVTTASSGLTALDSSSSPSSGYWSSCWDDLSSFLSIDLEQHPPPAGADAPPPHLHNFELS